MRYLDEFRERTIVERIKEKIHEKEISNLNIMEVCGTHTVTIFKYGLKELLPPNLRLLSGPGCPVCVTPQKEINKAIGLAQLEEDIILVTFGDMMKVPSDKGSLEEARSQGIRVEVVYSAEEALELAKINDNKRVVFFAVGFETTAPTIAFTILQAKEDNLGNFSIISALKLIPPALYALLSNRDTKIDGFILPGHVSTIIGVEPYIFIAREFSIPAVISGFEPLDILQSIYFILEQLIKKEPKVENQYKRSVREEGNIRAKELIQKVFDIQDASWRGLGNISKSGLKLKAEYKEFDAEYIFKASFSQLYREEKERKPEEVGCICGLILKGKAQPPDCPLFAKICTPELPYGPCMVSSEGTCSAWYKYGRVVTN
jgi:hydrogenase expression/formation protein HypD